MPKSQLDWLGIVSLWVGAIVMAFKSADAPLMTGAPSLFAAGFWGYVPLTLVTIYLLIALFRLLRPLTAPANNRVQAPEPAPAAAPIEPAPDMAQASRDARTAKAKTNNLLFSLQFAEKTAREAVARESDREAEKTMPEMKAALLSANKEFGIPLPPSGNGPVHDLEVGRRLIEKILPLLTHGHIEEAQAEAAEFNARFSRPDDSPTSA